MLERIDAHIHTSAFDWHSMIVRRRQFLWLASTAGLACTRNGASGAPPASGPACAPTEDNILGPYYKDGAPVRTGSLADGAMPGVRFRVSGRVLAPDCVSPLEGAVLDVWQADSQGVYDNTGFTLRGKLLAGTLGAYAIATIVPGHYLNGSQYRPSHIHVRISAPGFEQLTTQLYFEGDPYNGIDPFIKPSLVMQVSEGAAEFDFVLRRSV
jgi:protocatechuate 3,4-dioxygenase beta subunit